ncbi:MAG TPA: glycosyltransferase [Deltaproteobacteria bacterium]|jgi:MGT family glycosyltransferase|nr:glycosyltransferase family 1 protein [Deltaproteobacteria bacterium]MDI9559576.1 glycosyltransferase [Pseudomonadota bacterium]HRT45259.1 glycosyltransferase [Desulfomonilia bacterium]HOD71060.1 glycosyltransferase [Deltaproteobacteria bacterium]HOE72577.1 glycosyltransferase [Deltaproteobacteria bacterium]
MSKVIFLTHPTIGHLNSLLTIALKMRENGHDIQFVVPGSNLADPRIKMFKVFYNGKIVPEIIRSRGIDINLLFPPLPYIYLAALIPTKKMFEETITAIRFFSSGIKSFTRRISRLVKNFKPDIIVSDFFFYSTPLVAELNNLPYIMIYHSGLPFGGKDVPPFGSGLPVSTQDTHPKRIFREKEQELSKRLITTVNRARKAFSLKPVNFDLLKMPYSPWLNLVATHEAIDIPRYNLGPNTVYVGPIFMNMGINRSSFPYDELCEDKYKIYVSLGTVFNDKPKIYQDIIRALQENPHYQIIVSAGGAYDKISRKRYNSNVMLFQSVPQAELLKRIDLVVSHGGNNTLNETLYHGKPVIVLPVGGEQHDNASRIEFHGLGYRIDMALLSADTLSNAVEGLRKDAELNQRLKTVSNQLMESDGATASVSLIEWVMENKKPFTKKRELPLTITRDSLPLYLQD